MTEPIKLHVFGVHKVEHESDAQSEAVELDKWIADGSGDVTIDQLRREFLAQERYRQALQSSLTNAFDQLREMAGTTAPKLQSPAPPGSAYRMGFAAGSYAVATEATKLIVDAVQSAEQAVKQ